MYDELDEVRITPIEKVKSNIIIESCDTSIVKEVHSTVKEVHSTVNHGVVKSSDSIQARTRKSNKGIKGYTLQIYNYVKNNDGVSILSTSQYLGKKTDFIRPYLHNLKDYGLIIKENDKWYLAKEN